MTRLSTSTSTAALSYPTMKGFAAAVCLSLVVAVVNSQTPASGNSVVTTCNQVCLQACDICFQIMSIFTVVFQRLEPYSSAGLAACNQGCEMGCGYLG